VPFALSGYDDTLAAMTLRDPERFWHSLEGIVSIAAQLPALAAAAGLPLAEDSALIAQEVAHAADVKS